MLHRLLQAGADVHALNSEGTAAIQMAKNLAVRTLLLEYTATQRLEIVAHTQETQ